MDKKQSRETIKFSFYLTEKNCISIPASPEWTLEEAVKKAGTKFPKLKGYSFKDHILFAQLNGPVEEASISPRILCSKLLPDGKIRAKTKKDSTPDPVTSEEGRSEDDESEGDEETSNRKAQTLFFVKSTNPGITKISSNSYDGKHLGVIFYDGDTIENALLNDGRFPDVQDLELRIDDDRNSAVGLNYQASDYPHVVFNAKRRSVKKRKRLNGDSLESVNPSEDVVYSSMPQNLSQPFSETFGRQMIKDARRSALKMFAEAGVVGHTDDYIRKVTRKFGKLTSSEIPARIVEPIGQATKSVGYIECGDVCGTCFLVDSKYVITCFHIISDILLHRSQSTDPERFKDIIVRFGYNYSHDKGPAHAVVDENVMQFFCVNSPQLDYAVLPVKPFSESSNLSSLPSLGRLVRSVLPRSGRVILVGHPEARHKLVEICSILPGYNWHATICARAEEAGHRCDQNPEECHLNDPSQSCVHIHRSRKPELEHADHLPYDTSFFHGASGSPVFNTDGHIVALHMQGYPFYQGAKKVSLMEFGVTFNAICQDVRNRYSEQHARRLFPEIEI